MKLLNVSLCTVLIALGQTLVAIGQHNGPALGAGITALVASFLPSVMEWFAPQAPSK